MTTSSNGDTRVCACGAPTWRTSLECATCASKKKRGVLTTCNWPGCKDTYLAKGKARYCVAHKALTSVQLAKAKKEFEINALKVDFKA